MEIFNRSTLKRFFQRGQIPTEVHFTNLIDSTINKIDDGFAKDVEDGLKLSPIGESQKLISFFEDIKETHPAWSIAINPNERSKGLSISESTHGSRIFLQKGGNIGMGTTSPSFPLEVEGAVGMKTRVGTYPNKAVITADGEWHIMIENLAGCNMFEIVAKVEGMKQRGKYAFAHAIAVGTHDSRNNKIKITQAQYGWFWHRLKFRWKQTRNGQYQLEIKSAQHYGNDENNQVLQIKYHITSLWDDKLG